MSISAGTPDEYKSLPLWIRQTLARMRTLQAVTGDKGAQRKITSASSDAATTSLPF